MLLLRRRWTPANTNKSDPLLTQFNVFLMLLWLLKPKRRQESPTQQLRSLVKELKAVVSENHRPHTDNNGGTANSFQRRRSAPGRVNRTTLYVVSLFPHTVRISATPQPAYITFKILVILLSEQEIVRVKEKAFVSGFSTVFNSKYCAVGVLPLLNNCFDMIFYSLTIKSHLAVIYAADKTVWFQPLIKQKNAALI